MSPAPGERVEHRVLGQGVVRVVLDGGRKVRVAFDRFGGVTYTLPSEELTEAVGRRVVEVGGRLPAEVLAQRMAARLRAAASAASIPPAQLRQVLEALRMGVVPPALLELYSVGRESELERIDALFQKGQGLLVIEGFYGTGKTHLIEMAEAVALSRNYLTSRIEFDPTETPPSHPLRIYRHAIRSLRYPPEGKPGGLAPLLSRLSASEPHRKPAPGPPFHAYLSAALHAFGQGNGDLSEEVLSYVEGRGESNAFALNPRLARRGWKGPKLLALPDYRTFGQVYTYLFGGIASWARDAGWAGLALFFDEAEYLDELETVSRQFAETVLRYFAAATLPPDDLAFDPSALYRGGQSVHRAIPHRFTDDQPLVAVFAFTPLEQVRRAIGLAVRKEGAILNLEGLSDELLPSLAERVIEVYRQLYPEVFLDRMIRARFLEHLGRAIERGAVTTTREAARLTVEYLDLVRHQPGAAFRALVG